MNLRKSLFILPNLFTLSSIFCGFNAIRLVAAAPSPELDPHPYYLSALMILFAGFFDIIDGRVARLTRTQSAFGVQIDSLADVISFGVATSVLAYRWALSDAGNVGIFAAFAFCACGAIRLARFNVLAASPKGTPTKPGKYILGLPIPGAAGVILALILANHAVHGHLWTKKALIVAVMFFLSFLMVSSIEFRSFKDVKLNGRSIAFVSFAVGSTLAVATQWGPAFALPWMLGSYIALALVESVVGIPRRRRDRLEARRIASSQSSANPDEPRDP